MRTFLLKILFVSVLLGGWLTGFGAVTIDSITITPYTCDTLGYSNGKVTVYAHGTGSVPAKLLQNGTQIGTNQTVQGPSFSITFTDSILNPHSGNTYTVNFPTLVKTLSVPYGLKNTFTWPPQMTVTIAKKRDVTCALLDSNGIFVARPNGGGGDYTFAWSAYIKNSTPSTDSIADSIYNATSYQCTVLDKYGCIVKAGKDYYPDSAHQVLNPLYYDGPWPIEYNQTDTVGSCGAQNNGVMTVHSKIQLSAARPFKYSLVDSISGKVIPYQLSNIFTNLAPSTYYVWTEDTITGCKYKDTVNAKINSYLEPIVNAGAATVSICQSNTLSLSDATASNVTKVSWTSSDNGDSFSGGGTMLNPIFTPVAADTTAKVTLTLTGQNANPLCNAATSTRTVTVAAIPTLSIKDTTVCSAASYLISNSKSSYCSTYSWSVTGASNGTFDDATKLHPTYTPGVNDIANKKITLQLSATSKNVCAAPAPVSITITVIPPPTATITSSTAEVCTGNTLSIADDNATNYSSLAWSTSGTGTFSTPTALHPIYTPNVADGTVTLTLKANGNAPCSVPATATKTLTLDPLPAITASASPTSICIGLSSTLTATGGVSYNWSNGGSTPQTVNPVATTTYTVTGTDSKTCTNTASTVVTVNQLPTVTATSTPPSICIGFSSTLSASGANTYVWDDGVKTASQTVTPGTTTTYTVTGTDSKTCVNTATVTLTVYTLPAITATASKSPICVGETPTLTAAGGKTYTWSNNSTLTSQVVTPATTTNYTVTGTDVNGCTNTAATSVTVDPLPTVNAGGNDTVCSRGDYTLSKATAFNASNPIWTSSGNGTFGPQALNPIKYTPKGTDLTADSVKLFITVNGAGACASQTAKDSMTLTMNDPPTVVITKPNPAAICANTSIPITDATIKNAGSISWSTSGAGSFDATTVSNPNYTNDVTKTTIDILTVTVTGKKACNTPATATKTLTLDPPPTAFAGGDATNCNNGHYTFTKADTTNAAIPLTWSTSSTDGLGLFTTPNTLNPVYTPSNSDTLAGSVKLTITVNGVAACSAVTATNTMTLKMNSNVTADAGPNLNVCKGTNVSITKDTAINQTSLLWTSQRGGTFSDATKLHPVYTPTAADLTAGSFTLTLTANGAGACPPAIATTTITLQVPPTAYAGPADSICFSTLSYTLSKATASNTSSLLWSGGGGTFDNKTILNPTYSPNAADIAAGSVTLTLTADGKANCAPATSSMTLKIDKGPQISAGNDDTICYGSKVTMSTASVTAGTYKTFSWSSTDGTGSFTSTTVLHPIYTPGTIDSSAAKLKATVILTATGFGACATAKDTAIVMIRPQIKLAITGDASTSCYAYCDAHDVVTPSIGLQKDYTYTWTSLQHIPVAGYDNLFCSDTYTVTATDVNGCSVSKSFTIAQPDQINPDTSYTDNTKCFGNILGTATVAPKHNVYTKYSFAWSSGSPVSTLTSSTISNLAAGIYIVTITETNDGKSCNVSSTFIINQPPELTDSFAYKTPSCITAQGTDNDGKVYTFVNGGTPPYQYTWSTGGTKDSIINVKSGAYTLTVKDSKGCILNATATLLDPIPLAISLTTNNNKCYQDTLGSITSLVTGGAKPYQYFWDDPNSSTTPSINLLPAGTYNLFVQDSVGCSLSQGTTLIDPAKFTATVGQPSPFLITKNTTISVCFQGTEYSVQDIGFDLIAPNGTVLVLSKSPVQSGSLKCNYGQNFNICFTSKAATPLNMCLGDPTKYTMPVALLGNYKPVDPWTNLIGDDPANGGWTLRIEDWVAARTGETPSILQNVTLTFNDTSKITNDTVTVKYEGNNINKTIINPTNKPVAYTSYTVPLKLTTKCYMSFDAEVIATTVGGTAPDSIFMWNDAITGKPSPFVDSSKLKLADTVYLRAGNYTMVATDANGCQATSAVNVDQPKKIQTFMDSVNTTCFGSPVQVGKAIATARGDFHSSTNPYSFKWSFGGGVTSTKGDTMSTLAQIPAGKYIVTVTETENNFCSTTDSTIVLDTIKVMVKLTVDSAKCFGGNGSVYVSPFTENLLHGTSSFIKPYNFAWAAPFNGKAVTDSSLLNEPAGPYSVTVTDAHQCELDTTISILQPKLLAFDSVKISLPTCQGRTDAFIVPYISGGTHPYSYVWDHAGWKGNPDTLAGIGQGSYNVTVTDKNGCTINTIITVTDPPTMVPTLVKAIDTVRCWGDTTAKINASVINGTAPYTYTWSNDTSGVGLDSIYNLAAGTYTLTISDKYVCTVTASATIASHTKINITSVTTKNPTCFGGTDATISVVDTGGVKPHKYAWNKNGNPTAFDTAAISSLSSGSYVLTITDNVGCTLDSTITITDPLALKAAFAKMDTVKCWGDTNAYIKATIANGKTPYVYSWSNGKAVDSIFNLSTGKYILTVADDNSCQLIDSTTIETHSKDTITKITITNPTCFGGKDAAIAIVNSGGVTPYSYTWNPAELNAASINGLSSGNYKLTIADKLGCTLDSTMTVTDPLAVQTTFTQTDTVACWGDKNAFITANVVNGTTPYNYTWSNGKNGKTINNLDSGKYYLTVSDNNHCINIDSTTIQTHTKLAFDISTVAQNPVCYGYKNGTINLHINGGVPQYSYNWNPAETDTANLSNLDSGQYKVTVTDKFGCMLDSSFKLTYPAALKLTFHYTDTLQYWGDTTGYCKVNVINGIKPFTYNWLIGNRGYNISASGDSLFDLDSNTYHVTITDKSGCQITDSVVINPRRKMHIQLMVLKPLNCPGDNIASLYAKTQGNNGPITYHWYKNDTNTIMAITDTITNLSAGNYIAHVSDSKFTIIDSIQVIDPTPLKIQVSSVNVTCFGLSTGVAIATVTNGVVPDSILWTDAKSDTLANKKWKAGQKVDSLTNLGIGTYSATLTYNGTCKVNASTQVIQNSQIIITTNEVDASCNNNGQISASAKGGASSPTSPYKFAWFPIGMPDSLMTGYTNDTVKNVGVDIYNLTVTDSLNCTASAQVQVKNNGAVMTAATDSIRFPTCPTINNGYYRVKPTGGSPYKYSFWSFTNGWWKDTVTTDSTGAALNLPSGSYKVYITNNPVQNCKEVVLFSIDSNYLTASVIEGNITCPLKPDGWAKVTASQGLPYLHNPQYRYNWSTGATTDSVSGLAAGSYTVSVTDSLSCQVVVKNITIASPPDNMTISLPNDTALTYCYTDSTKAIQVSVVGGIAPYTYDWDTVVGPKTATVPALGLGWHYVTVKDIGCYTSRKDSIYVVKKGSLSFTKIDTTFTPCGLALGTAAVFVNASSQPVSYLWTTNDNTDSISKLAVGYYGVTVTDANSCFIIDTVQISDTSHIEFNIIVNSNIHCAGKSIGIATVKDTVGGNGHFNISWGDGEKTWKATTLPLGITSVKVTDIKGCAGLNKVQILQDSVFSIDKFAVIADASCGAGSSNGSAKVSLLYGLPAFTYVWQDPMGKTIIGSSGDSILNVPSGTYTVSITDATTCEVTSSVAINKNPLQIDSVLQTNISCNGANDGTIKVAPKAGSGWGTADSYIWSNDSTTSTVTALSANKYYVTLTEAGNTSCLAIDSFTITQPSPISTTYQVLQMISCKDSTGKITAHVSGGTSPYSYLWNDKKATTDSTVVNYWTNTYKVKVTDKHGCIFNGSTNSTDTTTFTVKPGQIVPITCFGQAMGGLSVDTINSKGVLPYTYKWSHNALLDTLAATNLPTGTYSVTVSDDSSCTRTINFGILPQPNQINTAFTYPPIIKCNGDSTTVSGTVSGGYSPYTFEWFKQNKKAGGNDTMITNATAGQYVLNITDSKNCIVNDTVTLIQAPPIGIDTTLEYSGCGFGFSNGSIILDSISGFYPPYTYKWSNGHSNPDSAFFGLAAGMYSLTITDAANCVSIKNIPIHSLNFDSVKIDTIQLPLCQFNSPTGELVVNAWGSQAPYDYSWTYGNTPIGGDNLEIKNLLPGFYRVTVTSKTYGCSTTDSVLLQPRVTLDASIIVNSGDTTQYQICYGDSIKLTGDPKPTVIVGSAPLPAVNPKYVWGVYQNNSDSALATMSGTSGKTISVKPSATTTYYVRYSEYGCYTQPKTVEITQFPKVGLNIQILIDNQTYIDSTAIAKGFELSLKPKADPWFITKNAFVPGFVQYVWTSYDSLKRRDGIINVDTINQAYYDTAHTVALQRLYPEHTTWYYVTGKTNIGCYETDSVKITVVLGYSIPNAISPNGDNRNDIWKIPYIEQFPDAKVTIFNRWGIIVWEKDKDYNIAPFIGKDSRNKDLAMGTYYYLIEFNDTKGTQPKSGSITIVR